MRLRRNGTFYIFGEITSELSKEIVTHLLEFHEDHPDQTITIVLNSKGGEVQAAFAIIDTIRFIGNPVRMIAVGQASSMGAIILSCGTKGLRYALKNTGVTIHQPLGGVQGQATDLQNAADQIKKFRMRLNQILSETTGQSIEKVNHDTERDYFMWAYEAREYGIVDYVIESMGEITDNEAYGD